jgi:hypothetical protein
MMATAQVEVEFYGGPADGMVLEIGEDVREFVMPTPAMTPAEFIALEDGAALPRQYALSHIYRITQEFGRHTGKRLFAYRGTRRTA